MLLVDTIAFQSGIYYLSCFDKTVFCQFDVGFKLGKFSDVSGRQSDLDHGEVSATIYRLPHIQFHTQKGKSGLPSLLNELLHILMSFICCRPHIHTKFKITEPDFFHLKPSLSKIPADQGEGICIDMFVYLFLANQAYPSHPV